MSKERCNTERNTRYTDRFVHLTIRSSAKRNRDNDNIFASCLPGRIALTASTFKVQYLAEFW